MSITPLTAQVGDTIPEHVFGPISRTTLALYAGASGDHNPVHIDLDFVKSAGLDDVFAHGMLSMAQLGRLLSNWTDQAHIRALSTRFTALTPVGAKVTCSGEVTERFVKDGETLLRLKLAAHIDDGTQTLKGEALIAAR